MANIATNTHVRVLSREVKLTYLQSVMVRGGQRSAGELAGEGGGTGSYSGSASTPGSPGFMGIGASGGSSYSASSNDTGWVISRTWDETHFDKTRWAIGIRDIGAFNYRYAPTSEMVSQPFSSPRPIAKVSLRVVEQIPAIFPLGRRYITYYVSPDNGETWHEINPLDHPSYLDDQGRVIPRILTFNPDVGGPSGELRKFVETGSPVIQVRFRAVFRTAEGIDDPERYSPVLRSYRLQLYPFGGLSGA